MNTYQKIEDLIKDLENDRNSENNEKYDFLLVQTIAQLKDLKKFY